MDAPLVAVSGNAPKIDTPVLFSDTEAPCLANRSLYLGHFCDGYAWPGPGRGFQGKS